MRLLLGLNKPDSGYATIGGRPYRDIAFPLRSVGTLLEVRAVHPGRTARNHLLCLAQTQGLPSRRVDEVIDLVGLATVARKRAGGFSLGMGQRLGIAAALLGDPHVLLLDEPVNGLDPEGVLWIRNLMKRLAAQGRTVFVSSHLMSEMAVTADHLIVIGRGRLLADRPTGELIERYSAHQVLVRTPDAAELSELVTAEGGKAVRDGEDTLVVTHLSAQRIAELAANARIVVSELTPQRLEYRLWTRPGTVPHFGHAASAARALASTHSSPAMTMTSRTITPARCGRRTPSSTAPGHDKHPSPCDNDTSDSWKDSRLRQPLDYQEPSHFTDEPASNPNPGEPAALRGLMPSRNRGQIQIGLTQPSRGCGLTAGCRWGQDVPLRGTFAS